MLDYFNDEYHALFEPIKESERPLWSVVIPTFNCAEYLVKTLQSVLVQVPEEASMEILVVDDFSTKDDPKAVVEKYGQGRVQFFRQPKNVGKSKNYAVGLQMTKGHFIHMLHGDDTVNDGFYAKMEQLFQQNPETSVALCRCNYMDKDDQVLNQTGILKQEDGVLENFIDTIAVWQKIQPPSIVFKREVYETLGGYDNRLKYIEDWEFYVRAAVYFQYAYTPEVLANYRVFLNSSSQQSIRKGKRIATIWQVKDIIDGYLPDEIKARIEKPRKRAISFYLVDFIPKLVMYKDLTGYIKVLAAMIKTHVSFTLIKRILRFTIQAKRFA